MSDVTAVWGVSSTLYAMMCPACWMCCTIQHGGACLYIHECSREHLPCSRVSSALSARVLYVLIDDIDGLLQNPTGDVHGDDLGTIA
jgi:hypothetical protein